MKTFRLLPMILGLLLMGCSGFSVRYDYDQRTDFSPYKTFDWYSARRVAKEPKPENSIMDRRVAEALEKEFTARGFTRETKADPDFLVTYYPVYQEKRYQSATHLGWGSWGGHSGTGVGIGTTFPVVDGYEEGTLMVEVTDFKTDKMIWQAAAVGALTGLKNPEDANEVVGVAVKKLLEKFPPIKE